MGLITSVAALDGLDARNGQNSRVGKTESTGTNFQTVFKSMAQGVGAPESMDAIFEEAASRFGLSANLLKAVGKAESNFNPNAVSKSGAMGVMQLMPATAKSYGVTNPYDVRQNIMGGAQCLKEHLDRFGGNVSLALAAYNAGPNNVQKYGGIPPFKETQNYVKTVLSYLGGEPIYTGKMVNTSQSSSLSSSLNGAYGMLGNSYGLASSDPLGMMLGAASVDEDGETISMDKESFANLIQILRIQMMMNASREVGTITI